MWFWSRWLINPDPDSIFNSLLRTRNHFLLHLALPLGLICTSVPYHFSDTRTQIYHSFPCPRWLHTEPRFSYLEQWHIELGLVELTTWKTIQHPLKHENKTDDRSIDSNYILTYSLVWETFGLVRSCIELVHIYYSGCPCFKHCVREKQLLEPSNALSFLTKTFTKITST